MDLATDAFTLEILAPDKRAWSVDVPRQAPDGFEIRLDAGECRLRGVLLDDVSGDPLARRRVHAEPWSADDRAARATPSCVTDAEGRFELTGLAASKYSLAFSSWYEEESPYKGVSFVPDAPARSAVVGDPASAARTQLHHGPGYGDEAETSRRRDGVGQCIVPSSGGGETPLGTRRNISHTKRRQQPDRTPRCVAPDRDTRGGEAEAALIG
jgi:hypothetical protein